MPMQSNNQTEENINISEIDTFDSEEIQPPNKPQGITKNQKLMAGALAFFAFFIVIIWSIQFKNSLRSPFEYSPPPGTEAPASTCIGPNCPNSGDLTNKDTDGDGLFDYDELNVYKTSPYLEDSDSDGYTDKEEIETNSDPNCPTGRDCSGQALLNNSDKSSPATLPNDPLSSVIDNLDQPASQINQEEIEAILNEDFNADNLRQLLITAGMDKAILDQISDEELLSSFQEVVNEEQ